MNRAWEWLRNRGTFFQVLTAAIGAAAGIIAILGGLGVLGGSKDDGAEPDATVALTAALGRTQDAGSSRMQVRIETSDPTEPSKTASGVFDYRRRVGRIRFHDGSDSATVVYDGDTTYARIPRFRHGRWQRLPPREAAWRRRWDHSSWLPIPHSSSPI
jgi:hypothetical protein